MSLWEILTIIFVAGFCFVGGLFSGFYISKKRTEKYLKENPPISAKQIRAMYLSMGRKPSEAQIQSTLRAMGIKK